MKNEHEDQTLEQTKSNPKGPTKQLSFIDLFAGIGGFRLALQNLGCKCVFSSEIDKKARETYQLNFGELPAGDICSVEAADIPEHDILCGGFPCQAFSQLGRKLGLSDKRGKLYLEVARILRERQPKAFMLENVAHLAGHAGGQTLNTILEAFRSAGYHVPHPCVLNAADFGLPQHRKRLYIVGFLERDSFERFSFPMKGAAPRRTFGDIRERKVDESYYIKPNRVANLIAHRIDQFHKNNGFGYKVTLDSDLVRTIRCGGSGLEENIVYEKTSLVLHDEWMDHPRWMTPREWARAQGFPDSFQLNPSRSAAYHQLGNSVPVTVVKAIGESVIKALSTA